MMVSMFVIRGLWLQSDRVSKNKSARSVLPLHPGQR